MPDLHMTDFPRRATLSGPVTATMELPAYRAGLDELIAIHDAARAKGHGALIVVHTPYGGGVDPLLKHWRRHVYAQSESVFEGQCTVDGRAYEPLRAIVSRYARTLDDLDLLDEETLDAMTELLPSLGRVERAEGPQGVMPEQLHFFDGLGRLLVRLTRLLPSTIVIRDLQLAESATLAAIYYLLENVLSDPVARFVPDGLRDGGILGTCVVTVRGATPVMAHLRSRLGSREHTHFVSLKDAEEEELRDYLGQPSVVSKLMSASGGSVERLEALLEALPERAADLYLRRLDHLSVGEGRIVRALAVAGHSVTPDFLLRVAADRDADVSLSSLLESGVIARRVTDGRLAVDFPAAENRVVVYERIPAHERQELHRHVGALLEEQERLGAPVSVEEIASHYLRSDDDEKAIQYGLDAVERLHISFAYQRAHELLVALRDRAVGDPIVASEVLERLIDVSAAMGAYEEALTYCTALLEDAPPRRHGALLRKRGEIRLQVGAYADALGDFDEAVRLVEAHLKGDDARLEHLRLDASIAEAATGVADYDAAVDAADRGEGRVQTPTVSEELRELLKLRNTRGKVHYFRGEFDDALRVFTANAELAKRHRWPDIEVRALLNQGTIALVRRAYDDAEAIFQACLAFGTQSGNLANWAFSHLNLAVGYHQTHRYGEALEAYLRALATFKRSGNDLQFAVTAMNLATLYDVLGAEDEARELLRSTAEVAADRGIRMIQGRVQLALGDLEINAERWHAADSAYREAFEIIGEGGGLHIASQIRIGLARAAHGLGNRALRDRYLDESRLDGESPERREVQADHQLFEGTFALDEGRGRDAVPLLEAAVLAFEEQDIRERLWRARFQLALARAAEGALGEAERLLASGASVIHDVSVAVPEVMRDRYLAAPARVRLFKALERVRAGQSVHATEPAEVELDVDPVWREKYGFIVGEDARMHQIFRIIDKISRADSSVLIFGESGTGKELIAEAVHRHSRRADGPFIKINCAAFVETLLLSELFGHERGAFTGAMARKKGRFELADGGTLFIDEVGDISLSTQVALLRVLQERQFERVGGTETLETDVRLICATNRNLEEMVREGTFRLDLYYRLKGVVIDLPPLRDRRADVPLLVDHFSAQLGRTGRRKHFTRDALRYLVRYSWPGNIRELENFVRSMLLFVDGDAIGLANIRQFEDFFAHGDFVDDAAPFMWRHDEARERHDKRPVDTTAAPAPPQDPEPMAAADVELDLGPEAIAAWALGEGIALKDFRRRMETELIRQALVDADGNISKAAEQLGMKRPRLSQIVNADDTLREVRQRYTKG